MKIRLKAIMLFGLLALLIPLLLSYAGGVSGASHDNIVKKHVLSKNYTNTDCTACHTTLTENSANTEGGLYPGAHRRHFLSTFLNFAPSDPAAAATSGGCAHCHQQTVFGGLGTSGPTTGGTGTGVGEGNDHEGDLSYTTVDPQAPIRKQVDPDVCLDCHGGFNNTGSHAAPPPMVISDCATGGGTGACHGSGAEAVTTKHAPVWGLDQAFANAWGFCGLCHGGPYVWFEQTELTGVLWP